MSFQQLSKQIQQFVKLQNSKNVLLVRHAQSMGNHSNQLAGWTDSHLSQKGRLQAKKLHEGLKEHINSFSSIHSSDLVRSVDTAQFSLGMQDKNLIKLNPLLREINFGKEEGVVLETLSKDRQELFFKFEYQAIEGESWSDTRNRGIQFFKSLPIGNHLIYAHGGIICSLTWFIGFQTPLSNCSMVALQLDQQTSEPNKMIFNWDFPKDIQL